MAEPDTTPGAAQSGPPTLSRASQKRWAVGGCVGCLGFVVLAASLSLLSVKNALAPANVWGQLSAYVGLDPEAPPEGYRPLFVLPFFDQRQIAFYRASDETQVLVQEYSGRVREDFDLAFDVEHLAGLPGIGQAAADTLTLQGREVEAVRFLGAEELEPEAVNEGGLRGWIVDTFDLRPDDLPVFRRDTPVVRIRFSGAGDAGGTTLNVRSATARPLTEADLEELLAPFDLWRHVDSAPQFVDPDATPEPGA